MSFTLPENIVRPRLRLLSECYAELIALDPNTSVSRNFIRCLAISGTIRTVKNGNRRLIDFDDLLRYLGEDGTTTEQPEVIGQIRKVR